MILTFKQTKLGARQGAIIGSLVVDASISETHQIENEVTEHPVEMGANIIDHFRPKPRQFTIEGMITNTPLPTPGQPSAADPTRSGNAYATLLQLRESATLINVITGLGSYPSMLIRTITIPRDAKTGNTLRFSAQLIEVRTVALETVTIPEAKVSTGKRAAEPTPAATRSKSTLAIGDDLLGNKPSGGINSFLDGQTKLLRATK